MKLTCWMCLLLLAIFIIFFVPITEAQMHLYVGKHGFDYTSIQQAINDAEAGAMIHVYPGEYFESILLHKQIQLIAEPGVILSYNGSADIISIRADNCRVSGFTIQNGSNVSYAAINIESDNNVIDHNIIKNNLGKGIYLYYSHHNSIINNRFFNDSINIIGKLADWLSYTIENNTVDGYPLLYHRNLDGQTISNQHLGQLILVNCSNCMLKNLSVSHADQGITLGYSNHNIITQNNLSANGMGLRLQYSDQNTILNNTIKQNEYGIYITHSFENIVTENVLTENTIYGAFLCCNSKENTLYLNRFFLNQQSAYDLFENHWSKDGIGNYWSDYTGSDINNDGIGETPYDLFPEYASAKDAYPIVDMNKISTPPTDTPALTLLFIIVLCLAFVIYKKRSIND